ncbi:response regulator transcription factor, partial [Hydrogenimonas sp.]
MSCRAKLSRLKILLVEDEKRLAELLEEAIGDYFADFEIASDGISGLKAFRKTTPDVVITDITMPKMTGLELAEAIKKESP